MFEALFSNAVDAQGFMLTPALLHPLSSGTVRLASADYRHAPVVDPQYLSNEQDLQVLLEGDAINLLNL